MSDREARVEDYFFRTAAEAWECRFLLGGNGWDGKLMPANVRRIDHLPPAEHRAFYNAQRFTLNATRADMVRAGYSSSLAL